MFHSEWRTGVTGINEQLFEIVSAFTNVLSTLIQSIPIGVDKEQDKLYG